VPGRLILLTTHSMEEAEALCTRIGIMAKGELKCIGSAQHLKNKYGKGYILTVNLLTEAEPGSALMNQLTEFVTEQLGRNSSEANLISSVNRTKKFLIKKSAMTSISEIFRLMEMNKGRLSIREWGLSLSTLEDAFITAVSEN
jgi:ATP-binding cassette subfamily A (ABC1) protein 5